MGANVACAYCHEEIRPAQEPCSCSPPHHAECCLDAIVEALNKLAKRTTVPDVSR